jgi:hypothetical protein
MSNSENDDLRLEYDLEKLGPAVRGKYSRRYQESTNIVVIDSDLQKEFPNAKAVNDALRELLESRRTAI